MAGHNLTHVCYLGTGMIVFEGVWKGEKSGFWEFCIYLFMLGQGEYALSVSAAVIFSSHLDHLLDGSLSIPYVFELYLFLKDPRASPPET